MKITSFITNIWQRLTVCLFICVLAPISLRAQDCNTRLFVAYTEKAAQGFGKTVDDSVNNALMKAGIDSAIVNINTSFTNSEINHWVELAGIERVGNQPDNCFYNNLVFSMLDGDGHWDSLHQLRNKYKADVVAIIVDNNSACGLSGATFNANEAFIVIHYECLTENYSLARQLGYLYGCGNHENNDGRYSPAPSPASDIAKGFWFEDDNVAFSTIMAYTDESLSYRPGDPSYDDFNLIPYWSNPNVMHPTFTLQPIGDETHDNAAVINENGSMVASYINMPLLHTIPSDVVRSHELGRPHAGSHLTLGSEDQKVEIEDGGQLNATAGRRIVVKRARFEKGSRVRLSASAERACFNHQSAESDRQNDPYAGTYGDAIPKKEKAIDQPLNVLSVYPNPFEYTTDIEYIVEHEGTPVYLVIHDLNGQVIEELVYEKEHPSGKYTVTWQAPDGLTKNIYICRIVAGSMMSYRKIILIR